MMLAGVLLAVVFAGGSDDEVVQREHVRFTGTSHLGTSCRDAIASDAEPGLATIRFQYQLDARRLGPGRFSGKVTFTLADALITMPTAIGWPRMTHADRQHAALLREAIAHHEIGHVRVAEAVRDELNEREPLSASGLDALRAAADALGRAGFERFHEAEREYDALTDHGRKQHLAPGVLSGPDTVIVCRSANETAWR